MPKPHCPALSAVPPAGLARPMRAMVMAWAMALLLALAASPAQAQYKWKDERGQVHLSDLPPPNDVPERNILQRPQAKRGAAAPKLSASAADGPGPSASGPAAAPQDPELAKRRAAAEAAESAKAGAEAQRLRAERAQNCQRARQQLAMVQSGQRLVRVNAAGERVVVDDATRQAELQLARRVADADCR